MLPPAFVEYALRNGADGVLVTGCRDGDCAYRLGNRWTEERLDARREPHLRKSVPRERIRVAWHGTYDGAALARTLADFRAALRSLGANRAAASKRAAPGARPVGSEDRHDAHPNAT
jgi:coenzyme F420-reducing hydrogenase delta subunit